VGLTPRLGVLEKISIRCFFRNTNLGFSSPLPSHHPEYALPVPIVGEVGRLLALLQIMYSVVVNDTSSCDFIPPFLI
jgi:hypothetical protein